ncbi:MAG: outer membrane protein assembly factor BamD [Rhodospirillales bacterium]|nr:outer membrane protein assembly factor BamD [Rhodospirillales bacterium]
MIRLRSLVLLSGLVLALAACSSGNKDEYIERPIQELYNSGVDALFEEKYKAATKAFDEVERQHPYSVWATKAQMMGAYAAYRDDRYDDAIASLDRFIQLNPSNRDAPYAYYLKALCYWEQISDVQRDAKMTELALKSLDEVIRRFPETTYARDARIKIDLTYDHLAGKEMEVGRFYLVRGQYVAAINRFKFVVDKYQTTSHVPEALHRLIEAYMSLGLVEEATKTAAVLGYNYPGNEWYVDSYTLVETGKLPLEDRPGFIRRTWNRIF